MTHQPSRIPSGLSWGMPGFRVGKSLAGNWWISIALPLGFRYFRIIARPKSIVNQNSTNTEKSTITNNVKVIKNSEESSEIINRINKKSYSKITPKQ